MHIRTRRQLRFWVEAAALKAREAVSQPAALILLRVSALPAKLARRVRLLVEEQRLMVRAHRARQ